MSTLETLAAEPDNGHQPEHTNQSDPDQQRGADGSHRPRARYRFGFFARYLRQFVLAKMDAEGWRQYDVAKFLDMPTHALSEYLNRHTHPSRDRRLKLLRLGCEESELARAEFADKLEWWMSSNGLGPDAVIASLDSIQSYEQEMRFAKVGRSGLRQSARPLAMDRAAAPTVPSPPLAGEWGETDPLG